MEVIIKIKSPSAAYQDLELTCDVSDTVIRLKQRIAEDFPTKPSVTGQKLVYSGKILKDSDVLENVLRFEDDCQKFTFHLVCAMPQKKTQEPQSSTPSSVQQPEPSFPDGLRQRTGGHSNVETNVDVDMNQMMQEFSNQYTEAMASMTNNPTEADIAAMQQLYNQYVSVYMQYMQSQSWDQQQAAAAQMFFPPAAGAAVQDQGHGQEPAAQGADQVDAGAGMVMNAGGPGAAAGQIQEAQGGDRQRDILDWVYVMTRVMLLVSVIYFHSSFLRLAFVVGVGFFAYFYQNRVRQMRLQRQRLEQQQRQRQQQADQQQQQDDNQEDASDASNDEEAEEAEDMIIEEPAPSKLAVFLTFCTTFVTSLMPENPQVI